MKTFQSNNLAQISREAALNNDEKYRHIFICLALNVNTLFTTKHQFTVLNDSNSKVNIYNT